LGGMSQNRVKALAWHLYARARGDSNPMLDDIFAKLPQNEQEAAFRIFNAWETGGPLPRS
jgi:hypothetical protein